jgi:hypothetical protein
MGHGLCLYLPEYVVPLRQADTLAKDSYKIASNEIPKAGILEVLDRIGL